MSRMHALLVLAVVSGLCASPMLTAQGAVWTASLPDIRAAARMIPGVLPLRLNAIKFAESRRTKNFSVKGAPPEPSVQARTAFQVVYDGATVMVDAGMSRQIHSFFGRGAEEPYDASAFARLERALDAARLIVVTHEHGDHVAGVVTGPNAATLATRTLITRAQVHALATKPQMPALLLTEEQARRYLVVDYDTYLPVAPGVVLIKAAGHTPGSQMVYVALASGREFLLIGDTAWHMDGVRTVSGKDAPWVTEDQPAVMAQLAWLNSLSRTDPSVVIVASHDDEQLTELMKTSVIGSLE